MERLALDADQLWAFHGFRVHHTVYLGYGLGWAHRQLRLSDGGATRRTVSESGFLAGLMVDWTVGLPYGLQLRYFQDLESGLVRARAATLQLTFLVEF